MYFTPVTSYGVIPPFNRLLLVRYRGADNRIEHFIGTFYSIRAEYCAFDFNIKDVKSISINYSMQPEWIALDDVLMAIGRYA